MNKDPLGPLFVSDGGQVSDPTGQLAGLAFGLELIGSRDVFIFEISGDVIQNALGLWDTGIGSRTGGFETHPLESTNRILNRQSVLQADREASTEALDQAGKRRAFLAHLDEDLSGAAIIEEADGEVALITGYREFMGDGLPGIRENMTVPLSQNRGSFHPWALFQWGVAVTRNHPWILLNHEIGPLAPRTPKSAQQLSKESQDTDHKQTAAQRASPTRWHKAGKEPEKHAQQDGYPWNQQPLR